MRARELFALARQIAPLIATFLLPHSSDQVIGLLDCLRGPPRLRRALRRSRILRRLRVLHGLLRLLQRLDCAIELGLPRGLPLHLLTHGLHLGLRLLLTALLPGLSRLTRLLLAPSALRARSA